MNNVYLKNNLLSCEHSIVFLAQSFKYFHNPPPKMRAQYSYISLSRTNLSSSLFFCFCDKTLTKPVALLDKVKAGSQDINLEIETETGCHIQHSIVLESWLQVMGEWRKDRHTNRHIEKLGSGGLYMLWWSLTYTARKNAPYTCYKQVWLK